MKPALHIATGAGAADEAALRQLLRETRQEGYVQLSLEREPAFFSTTPEVLSHEVVAVRHHETKELTGCGTRTDRQLWLSEKEQRVAYLGDLRVHPAHRRLTGRVLQAGFDWLADLQAEKPAAATITAIFDDNQRALDSLGHARLGLPNYVQAGTLHTAAFWLPRRLAMPEMTPPDLEAAAAFLNEHWRIRDLAPVMTPQHLAAMTAVHELREGGRVIGVAALADLRAQRQMRVHGYGGLLHHSQRPLTWLLRLAGLHGLPRPGETMQAVFVAHFAARDVAAGRELLRRVRASAVQAGAHLLLLTQHENDPLLALQRAGLAVRSRGRLYQVAWPEQTSLTALHRPHVEGCWL